MPESNLMREANLRKLHEDLELLKRRYARQRAVANYAGIAGILLGLAALGMLVAGGASVAIISGVGIAALVAVVSMIVISVVSNRVYKAQKEQRENEINGVTIELGEVVNTHENLREPLLDQDPANHANSPNPSPTVSDPNLNRRSSSLTEDDVRGLHYFDPDRDIGDVPDPEEEDRLRHEREAQQRLERKRRQEEKILLQRVQQDAAMRARYENYKASDLGKTSAPKDGGESAVREIKKPH